MTYPEIKNQYNSIQNDILANKLRDAMKNIEKLGKEVSSSDFTDRYNTLFSTYQNMLKYSFGSAPDPLRSRVYNNLQQSALELADDILDKICIEKRLLIYSKYYSDFLNLKVMSDSEINVLFQKILEFELIDSTVNDPTTKINHAVEKERLFDQLFYTILFTNSVKHPEKRLFSLISEEKEIGWYIKAFLISAITLSLIRHFDREKFFLLFDYCKDNETEIRQRAIIGMFLCILIYQKRLLIYHDILERLESIPDDPLLQERFLAVFIQNTRAKETEKITKKIQEEIVPEVMKIKSELDDKLKLDELMSKENFDEKNPEWQNFFKDAPNVYQKLEQFSKMQSEGSDVFIGAFAMLKHFKFFDSLSNWFAPFSGKKSEIVQAFDPINEEIDIESLADGLEKSPVLCNSDKYSFCFNVQYLPAQQRKMVLDLFKMEIDAMADMQDDEQKINTELKSKLINAQYMQDIYRFFKLYPYRKEFTDVFVTETDILNSRVLNILFGEKKHVRVLAEFYFATDDFTTAYPLFKWLNQKEETFELLEKIGFCLQNTGNYSAAIEIYKRAEIYNSNKIWLLKKLSYCYRKTGRIDEAILEYIKVIKLEPENYSDIAYLGHLYIENGNYEQSLQYYYQVEYHDPKNIKICRPIGWCSFVLGKYDQAIKYFKKVIGENPGKSDYLNIGHCYWLTNHISKALEAYRQSVKVASYDINWFREAFQKDSKYLIEKGFEELEINLMIDYVLLT
jgi:tetratricopeptide (TPR) repeat protein